MRMQRPASRKPTKEQFYSQTLNWRQCEASEIAARYRIRTARYRQHQRVADRAVGLGESSTGNQITLPLAVHRGGQSERQGSVLQPGGPWWSIGVLTTSQVTNLLGRLVSAHTVALDPRGRASTLFVVELMKSDGDAAGTRNPIDPNASPAEMIVGRRYADAKGRQTSAVTFFKHIDTVNASKDFDMARALLGQETNYLGYPWNFPGRHLRRAPPPVLWSHALTALLTPRRAVMSLRHVQMRGFALLRHWVEDCQAARNPVRR